MRGAFPALWLSMRGVWVLLWLALALAGAAAFPPLAYAVVAAAVLFVACVAADIALGPSSRTLRVARQPVPLLALRRSADVTYDIENRADVGVRVGIVETPLPTIEIPPEGARAGVPARSSRTLKLAVLPRERGRVRFGDLYAWSENRIGLVRRRYRIAASEDARVFPDLSAVSAYGTLARRSTLVEAGLRRLRRRGVGTEFESLREYLPGDAFRLVDWKATARRGRMTVAQYDVERSQHVIVALDCGRAMVPRLGSQRKFDYALTAALSIARVAQAAGDDVGLIAFGTRPILSIPPRRGAAHYAALAQAAYDLQPRLEEPDYEATFVNVRDRFGKRALVVLLTDVLDPLTSAAVLAGLGLLVPRHLVMCVLLGDAALDAALATEPATPAAAYRTAVAMSLVDERTASIALLRARGIIVVDVPAPQLTVATMDAYLDIKARGRL